jgi:predicted TIM-barrel fold metal-dependent hydrolase
MRTITLEEHFAYSGFLEGPGRQLKERALQFGGAAATLLEQLCDLGEKRIAEMDTAGIDLQVLSLTSPGTEQLEAIEGATMAHEANELLAAAVKKVSSAFCWVCGSADRESGGSRRRIGTHGS